MNGQKDDIIRITHRMMDEKLPYYRDSAKYLQSVMKAMDQIELMKIIDDLNIHELKQCIAAGVPGDAMHHANLRLKELKAEIKAYIEKKGAEAHASVEVETTEEEDKDVVEGVQPSESGREGNSKTMGDVGTNSGK